MTGSETQRRKVITPTLYIKIKSEEKPTGYAWHGSFTHQTFGEHPPCCVPGAWVASLKANPVRTEPLFYSSIKQTNCSLAIRCPSLRVVRSLWVSLKSLKGLIRWESLQTQKTQCSKCHQLKALPFLPQSQQSRFPIFQWFHSGTRELWTGSTVW